jgi:hypothetical protein
MKKITPQAVFMVKPFHFGFNAETAISNTFQSKTDADAEQVKKQAMDEYDGAVQTLRDKGIEVLSYETPHPQRTPDAVFPNNWIGFHPDYRLLIYPMATSNRRLERHPEIVDWIKEQVTHPIELSDYSKREQNGEILEGTGSMIFDYKNGKVYGCISPRTSESLFREVAEDLKVEPVVFHTENPEGVPIYHTNVILTITEHLAIICSDCISDPNDRKRVEENLQASGLKLVRISFEQVEKYCGNLFEVKNHNGESFLVGSALAWSAFDEDQRTQLQQYHTPLSLEIPTIETIGGGSARCMVAGIHW